MEINYSIVIPVIVIVLIGIVLMIRRNGKDKKNFEEEVAATEIKPETHADDKI